MHRGIQSTPAAGSLARRSSSKSSSGRSAGQTNSVPARVVSLFGLNAATWIAALALAALVAYVFSDVATFSFLKWDDQLYVTANPHVVGGLTWSNVAWALTTTALPYWHPLARLSHLVDVQFFGMTAAGPHVVNVAIHLANTFLVWALVVRLTGARWRALAVAAVFAVHPLHVESVAWVAERKDVLSTAFALLSLLAYVEYVRRPDWRQSAVVAVLFGLALMAKPMVVTLPAVMLLLDVWPLNRTAVTNREAPTAWTALLREKAALFVLGLGVAVLTVVSQHGTTAMQNLSALPVTTRLADAIQAYVAYAGKALWPTHLAAFYPRDWNPSLGIVALDAVVLVVVSVAAFGQRAKRPYLLVGWLWFLVTLAPVIGLLQSGEQAMADRFMYVPLVGLTLAAVWGVADLSATWPARRIILASSGAAAVIACAVAAHDQTEAWHDDVTLWEQTSAATARNYMAEDLLGLALQERGDSVHAIDAYRAALGDAPSREPDFTALVHANLGDALARSNRATDAIAEYQTALTFDPRLADVQSDLGSTLVTLGRPADAVSHYQAALQLRPGFAQAENGLGAALAMLGHGDEAAAHYRAAVSADPELATAHTNLAMTLVQQGQTKAAVSELLTALRIEPNHATWEFNVGSLLMHEGLPQEASSHFANAVAIDPSFDRARQALETIAASAR